MTTFHVHGIEIRQSGEEVMLGGDVLCEIVDVCRDYDVKDDGVENGTDGK